MKKFFVIGALATLMLASCQKAQQDEIFDQTTAFTNDATITRSAWVPVSLAGGNTDGKGVTEFNGTVSETALNADILADGLVLLFAKQGESIVTLPSTVGGTEWSYEIATSSIALRANSTETLGTSVSVRYVVIPAAKIKSLETSGITRNDLMNMSYEKASSLFQLP